MPATFEAHFRTSLNRGDSSELGDAGWVNGIQLRRCRQNSEFVARLNGQAWVVML